MGKYDYFNKAHELLGNPEYSEILESKLNNIDKFQQGNSFTDEER